MEETKANSVSMQRVAAKLAEPPRGRERESARSEGQIVAWLGASQSARPGIALAERFLHAGALRDPGFADMVRDRAGAPLAREASAYFRDYDRGIITLGLAKRVEPTVDIARIFGDSWVNRAKQISVYGVMELERWLIRQWRYELFSRPYGSRLFRRIREVAIFNGRIDLAARPDLICEEATRLLERSSEAVIAGVLRGRHALL